jgi:hypothetical protein
MWDVGKSPSETLTWTGIDTSKLKIERMSGLVLTLFATLIFSPLETGVSERSIQAMLSSMWIAPLGSCERLKGHNSLPVEMDEGSPRKPISQVDYYENVAHISRILDRGKL